MASSAGCSGARAATLSGAGGPYGTGGGECDAVAEAWTAVNVR